MANVVSSVFYSYPPEVIAEWCAVSIETAQRWKAGESRPSSTALKLFALYRDRLVLGQEWNGWLVNRATIVDPEGNATTSGQLRAYYLNLQLLAELCRRNEDAYADYVRNLSMAG